ncbi:NgoFVII family restriction endonuclease [Priestia megaterium]|uniref:helicase-related protein n=1 Tax=Priestia megaterium TaxID=1404 RepID=UPI000BF6B41F|nr:helicase-related protein [Priestia megaterium]PFP32986.1 NgoFVII family restriction endonuclease [Priestia megaterium]
MPRIFDNIDTHLVEALKNTINLSFRADFCVGYFNLKGWDQLSKEIDKLKGGDRKNCRILIGMQTNPHDETMRTNSLIEREERMDNKKAIKLKQKMAEQFKEQLIVGYPTNKDEETLRTLVRQIKENKVRIKLYTRSNLHAKLYLFQREDYLNPYVGYLGSSNLTFSGLSKQGELNVDVLDLDAAIKLNNWFEERWNDNFCLDISDEITDVIEKSWAGEKEVSPYYIYSKMAFHLSQQAREGMKKYVVPGYIDQKLFNFQSAAIKLAANHLKKRKGVIIGDVVGLGKTMMATALMAMMEDEFYAALVIAPKNLVSMWENYIEEYNIRVEVVSLSMVHKLSEMRKYRLVVIDESHNLRNRESKRYKYIQNYILDNDAHVILLTATPYNKTYLDLSNQLRLFIPEDLDIGISPNKLISEIGETEFIRRYQCPQRSIAAFETSSYPEDWRELMRLYLVRRTRGFIQRNYAEKEKDSERTFLRFSDGRISYFPARIPKTIMFGKAGTLAEDQYAKLYEEEVIDKISSLNLPRYRLGSYLTPKPKVQPSEEETKKLSDLSMSNQPLIGFTRTNLLKRLESSSEAFVKSVKNHIIRNEVLIYALEKKLPLPIGTYNGNYEEYDDDGEIEIFSELENEEANSSSRTFKKMGKAAYELFKLKYAHQFNWVRPAFFKRKLKLQLIDDVEQLTSILDECGPVDPTKDSKLQRLIKLLKEEHPDKKVLIFTQYADTANYLDRSIQLFGIEKAKSVTGDTEEPTSIVWKFSPKSNNKVVPKSEQIRVLVATDVLSEGQNLQDCSIIVNYDLPWAIIRLIQRAGRVDRIGQESEEILCYSFMPAEGIEKIISLRARVSARLRANAEVIGTDEEFFEEDIISPEEIADLYNEKTNILELEDDQEVDLASYAYEVWKKICEEHPEMQEIVPKLPPVIHSTKIHTPTPLEPEGVLVFIRNTDGNDGLAWVGGDERIITQSPYEVLKVAESKFEDKAGKRDFHHFSYVKNGVRYLIKNTYAKYGGQLGRPSGARFKTYERLSNMETHGLLLENEKQDLREIIQDIYIHTLNRNSRDILNKGFRDRVNDEEFLRIVTELHTEDELVVRDGSNSEDSEPIILCSLGLFAKK